jgi:hypothetical protein
MLTFLRKHQKVILASTGALVIFSMCFFGISQKSNLPTEKKSVVLGKAVDGSKIKSGHIEEMTNFLSYLSNPHIGLLSSADDIFIKDVLDSGLALMLIQTYWPHLEEEMQTRLDSYQRYRPYVHPEMRFLSAENVWMRFAPEIYGSFEKFKEEKDPKAQVKHLISCFLAEQKFPEQLLRQFLYFQEQQFNPQFRDPYIQRGSLALFNVHSVLELLGPNFMQLATQFIYNAAIIAEQNGLRVSKEEAKAALICLAAKKEDPKKGEALLKEALQKMRMTQSQAVAYFQKVLLFRKLFEEVGGSIYLDSLAYDQINQFSHEELNLNIYAMPPFLAIDSFEKMMQLEIYLDHTAKRHHAKLLPLPTQFLSVDRVKSRCPKLVAKKFSLDVSLVKKSEIGLQVSLKDIAQYEITHFDELIQTVPELALKICLSDEDKMKAIESLPALVKEKIDAAVREKIVASHREWIEASLLAAKPKRKEVILNLEDINNYFIGFEDNNSLIEDFEKALANGSSINLIGDGDHFYRIKVISGSADYDILTFEEAQNIEVLSRILTERLERDYASIRSRNPSEFKNESGEFLPFSEVREIVGKYVFQDLISQLQSFLKIEGLVSEDAILEMDELAKYRQSDFMNLALNSIKMAQNQDLFVKKEGEDAGIENQFKLVMSKEKMSRSKTPELFDEQMARMKEGEWSQVGILGQYGLSFYALERREINETEKKKAMEKGYDLLVGDAKKAILFDLIDQMKSQNVLHIRQQEEALQG